jgi:hypothetical protein
MIRISEEKKERKHRDFRDFIPMTLLKEEPLSFEELDNLVKLLLEKKWLIQKDDTFSITKDGEQKVDSVFKGMRFHQNK